MGVPYTVMYVQPGEYPDNYTQWIECAANSSCARQCVENYLDKFRYTRSSFQRITHFLAHKMYFRFQCFGTNDPEQVTCMQNWRLHRNGPSGCTQPAPRENDLTFCCSTPCTIQPACVINNPPQKGFFIPFFIAALGCDRDESCLKFICADASSDAIYRCGGEFGLSPFVCANPNCNHRIGTPITFGAKCYCGVYQIDQAYWDQCYDPANNYTVAIPNMNACSADEGCATQCLRNYVSVRADYSQL